MRSCIILGSGRSGTSMLAGMLHASNYYLGDTLLAPTPSNPKGYFESREINLLNDELLASVVKVRPSGPLSYCYPLRLPSGLLWLANLDPKIDISPTPGQRRQMRELISNGPFCFKDPRFCYTLPAWRSMLNDAVFLCVFREPGRTVYSMKKDLHDRPYKGFYLTQRRALRGWTSMYQHVLEKHRAKGRWLFVHYDQILDGSAIPPLEHMLETKIDTTFIETTLKRSHDLQNLPKSTSATYQRLCTLAGTR